MTPSGLGNDARGHYLSRLTHGLKYGMRLRHIKAPMGQRHHGLHYQLPKSETNGSIILVVYRYEGPFPILGKVNKVSYKVELPPRLKIHPVFHETRCASYYEYYVKWKGLRENKASWESQMHYGASRSRLSDLGATRTSVA
ncbi:hypothetical protein AAG906_035253 [Vitis piasezkii]